MAKKNKVKGKSPKGRAGQKKKAQKEASYAAASLMRTPGRSRYHMGVDDDDDDDDAFMQFKGFAQALSHNNTPRTPSFKLRHQAISFISAGTNTPIEIPPRLEQESDDSEDDTDEDVVVDDSLIETNIVVDTDVQVSQHAMANMNLDGAADEYVPPPAKPTLKEPAGLSETSLFVFDTVGNENLAKGTRFASKASAPRAPSPTPSDSSIEAVVFHGRNKPTIINEPITPELSDRTNSKSSKHTASKRVSPVPSTGRQSRQVAEVRATEADTQEEDADLLTALEASLETDPPSSSKTSWPSAESSAPKPSGWGAQTSKHDQAVNLDATWAPAPAGRWWKQKSTQSAGAEETIAQLQSDWKQVIREKRHLKQDPDEPKSNRRGKRGRKRDNRLLRDTAHSSGDADVDASEAAYDDYIANLAGQGQTPPGDSDVGAAFLELYGAPRVDIGGPSIVIDGRELGDDELLDESMQISDGESNTSDDDDLIGQDLSELSTEDMMNQDLDLSGLDSSELDEALEYTEQQQWEDDADLRQRRVDAMNDEQIARLFAKQQELGIHGDELVLEDGTFDDSDGVGDVDAARAGLASIIGRGFGHPSTRPRRSHRRNDGPTFVDASLMANMVDQYGDAGFDIMDFDRPSLRTTKKGRKGKLPPELEAISDEELRDSVAQSWATDRSKKAQRKAEREELRAQGLLSSSASKTGKPDLREKYATGISMAQVHEELRVFLLDDSLTRAFPPMDAHDRAVLHHLCHILKLKSKSIGSGSTRYPVLTKTARTHFNPVLLANAISSSKRGFLGSRSGKSVKKAATGAAARGGGFNKAAVTLRNGEVVGAGAAEIGTDNFGHRMMEKMGWSKGQALGKDGEGRLIPVEQVMRSGRAGLG